MNGVLCHDGSQEDEQEVGVLWFLLVLLDLEGEEVRSTRGPMAPCVLGSFGESRLNLCEGGSKKALMSWCTVSCLDAVIH